MKKIILTAACAFLAGSLNAADFKLNAADALAQVAVAAPKVELPAAPKPAVVKGGQYVQVSGYVNLNGNGWMPGNDGGFTSVNLTGWATFRDSSGKVTSNNTYINTSVSLWVRPNQHVFQSVWPNLYVTFYRNGKIVGSTSMNGSISVSGWPSSSYFSLSGSGYLNGSIYVEDEQ
ncbi:MAG: hypothetical protein PHV33_06695 [Elusimicrobiales bacterium]|nr:hypothetical protein [Elusimicrobiales bacterium]